MAGVEGLGQRVLAGARSPQARAMAADLDHLGMQVTPENVLQVRNVLKAEAVRLSDVMRVNDYKLRVDLCGGDPVSADASRGFNAKLDNLRAQCSGYVKALRDAVKVLEQTAATYGRSEQEIKDSFDAFRPEPPPRVNTHLTASPDYSPEASILKPYMSGAQAREQGEWSPVADRRPGAAGGRL